MNKKIDEIIQNLKAFGEAIRLGKEGDIYLRYDREKDIWRYSDSYTREKYAGDTGDYLLTDKDVKKLLKDWEIYDPAEGEWFNKRGENPVQLSLEERWASR